MVTYDAIIIGAGLGGLSIGALLGSKGLEVLCVEKSHTLGGRSMVVKKDGFTYDYGIHVVRYGEKGACGEILKALGIDGIRFKKLDVAIYEDSKFHRFSSGGLPSLLKMGILSKKEKLVFLKELLRLTFTDIKPLYSVSVSQFIKDRGYSPGLEKIFSALSTSMLSCPDTGKASAGELAHHLTNVVKKRYAVGYPEGGFETIINRLSEKISEKGEIMLNNRVESLIRDKGRPIGVQTEQGDFYAKDIICAVPPQELTRLTDMRYNPYPTEGISIDYALNTDEYKEDRVILTRKVRGVALFTSNVDKSVAPEGKSLLTFFCPRDTKITSMEQKKAMDDLVEEMFPGIHSNIKDKRVLHLKVVDGVELSTGQNYYTRPKNKVRDGLYIVGDYTQAHGNGGEIAFNSALECYKEMVK